MSAERLTPTRQTAEPLVDRPLRDSPVQPSLPGCGGASASTERKTDEHDHSRSAAEEELDTPLEGSDLNDAPRWDETHTLLGIWRVEPCRLVVDTRQALRLRNPADEQARRRTDLVRRMLGDRQPRRDEENNECRQSEQRHLGRPSHEHDRTPARATVQGWGWPLLPLRVPAGGTALFGGQSNKRRRGRLASGIAARCNRGATQ